MYGFWVRLSNAGGTLDCRFAVDETAAAALAVEMITGTGFFLSDGDRIDIEAGWSEGD